MVDFSDLDLNDPDGEMTPEEGKHWKRFALSLLKSGNLDWSSPDNPTTMFTDEEYQKAAQQVLTRNSDPFNVFGHYHKDK